MRGGKQKSVEHIIMVLMEGLHTERRERETVRAREIRRVRKLERSAEKHAKGFSHPCLSAQASISVKSRGQIQEHLPYSQSTSLSTLLI